MESETPQQQYFRETESLIQNDSSVNHLEEKRPSLKPKRKNRTTPGHMSKHRMVKNLLVVCACFFMFFLGFQGLANLQSTMNDEEGLGMNSQAVIYAFSMLSAIFLPKLMIKRLGCKLTLVLMFVASCPYIAANFYPHWQTLIPSAVLFGLAAGPMSTAQAFYINELCSRYAPTVLDSIETVHARFYGVFAFFSENTQIWGNLISYYVLKPGMAPIHVKSNYSNCGISFNHHMNPNSSNVTNPNLEPPTDEKRYMLVSIYTLICILSAVLAMLCLDPLDNDRDIISEEGGNDSISSRLLAAVKHLRHPNQILLLPLTIYCGLEIAFYTGDFTRAYIACSWGVHHVGFVTICFGVCGAVTAILVGPLVKYLSQMTVLIAAAVINLSACAALFLWHPNPDDITIFFVLSGVWGMADAIWWSQITALYGLMFPENREAAFSNFFFWSFLGFLLSYSYANSFTIPVKINILLFFMLTGIIGYIVAQLRVKCSRRREYTLIVRD